MFRLLAIVMIGVILQGCSATLHKDNWSEPIVARNPIKTVLETTPELDGQKITIAVYGFTDKTGQRKPNTNFSQLSSAVTQGSEVWVIDALKKVGGGTWFTVLERVGLDNLVKERQLIRSTREVYEGKERENTLKPMLFAGLLLEGGVVGYETVICESEEEARARVSELLPRKKWPVFFFKSDTAGEKDFEEFFIGDTQEIRLGLS